ncbi:MAG: hypothetical protein SFW09_22410 [Hyphomicrobiaceae bacterium]|nr:hypothetical protein [Hyphomicrobiaceae bacterium]
MRTQLAASMLALATAAFATPSDAQTAGRNGGPPGIAAGGQGGSLSQRAVQPRTFNQPGSSFRQRSIQPPPPGGSVAAPGNRSFRSIQPPPPGGSVAAPGNRSFRSIQPPPPGGSVAGESRSFQGPRPQLSGGPAPRSTFVPTAAAAGAAATAVAVGSASRPAGAAPVSGSSGNVDAPIDPVATPAPVATVDAGLPPVEMLASVGAPIVPLGEAPNGRVETTAATVRTEARVVRAAVDAESCNVPAHGGYRIWRRY